MILSILLVFFLWSNTAVDVVASTWTEGYCWPGTSGGAGGSARNKKWQRPGLLLSVRAALGWGAAVRSDPTVASFKEPADEVHDEAEGQGGGTP